ncbi:MAG TPA: hypothetical protein DEA96_12405 [Leptospiraceae bacterium]|nr:hypothetical protein [Spirochaetaceae bacterium]MBU43349.1 hypothetical protein [Spirochaetaceae bacterium]HBS05763.1 hypothetical protein [Leptospiraceae bacterium]|tara:strand:- start:7645 stop:8280 length:636 start_codon:yes stop_codon:yes gene_type:complete
MLARQKIVGPGQLVPAEPGQKPQKKPRGKKGPRMSLLRRIERLSHHNVQRFSGWCFAGNDTLAADYDVEPRTIRRWFRQLENEKLIETKIVGNIRLSRATKRGLGALADEGEADKLTPDAPKKSAQLSGETDIESVSGGQAGPGGGHSVPVHSTDLCTEYVLATLQKKLSPSSYRKASEAYVAASDGKVIFLHLPNYLEEILRSFFDAEFI